VTRIRADDEDPAIPPDDLAFLAHWLDRGSYFHARLLFSSLFVVFLSPALETGAAAATELKAAQRKRSRYERTDGS
jgi:hypothetical protein